MIRPGPGDGRGGTSGCVPCRLAGSDSSKRTPASKVGVCIVCKGKLERNDVEEFDDTFGGAREEIGFPE